jgi:DNA repair protein RecO
VGIGATLCGLPSVVDQAVCIRVWDWSETSQTVSLFGRDSGLLRGIAKGSKREGSLFSGGIQVLTRGEVVAIVKPANPLATLTAWDLQEMFAPIRRSLPAFYAGMYFADLVQHTITDSDPHPRLFDALVAALRGLGDGRENQRVMLEFQWAVLAETGYKPELGVDVAAGGELAVSAAYGFSPRLGGLVADPAREGAEEQGRGVFRFGEGQVWRVRAQTVDVLRDLERDANGAAGESGGGAVGGEGDAIAVLKDLRRANRLLASYLRELLGREPPAMQALFRLEGFGGLGGLRSPGGSGREVEGPGGR